MTYRFRAGLILSLTLSLAGTAFAQDAGVDQETPPNSSAQLDLSAGEPVETERPTSRDQVQPGQLYVPEVSRDWEIRCGRAPEGQADPCQMYQLVRDESGNPTAEITLFRMENNPNFVAGALVVTPLETLLTRALTLGIDSAPAKRYPFKYCNAVGCVSEIGLTQAEVDAMKRGVKGVITIVPLVAPNTNLPLTLSLSGFTGAYDKLPPR